jgi:hypothetical protein
MDHHVHAAITEGLRRRGVDVITAHEDGAAEFADERLIQRVVISMLCCGPGEVVVANEVLDGTNMIGQLLGKG